MAMSPRVRKFALTIHIISSVGWLGAVVSYLVVAVGGLFGPSPQSVLLILETLGWRALVPLAVASVCTGLTQSLGTDWGLIRHYWVLTKFALTLVGTSILIVHMKSVSQIARIVSEQRMVVGLEAIRSQLLVHAVGGLKLLVAIAFISVYKPWGLTPWARRKAGTGSSP